MVEFKYNGTFEFSIFLIKMDRMATGSTRNIISTSECSTELNLIFFIACMRFRSKFDNFMCKCKSENQFCWICVYYELIYIEWSERQIFYIVKRFSQIYHERYKCLETLLYIVMGLGECSNLKLISESIHLWLFCR